ncbi:unnamed protein product [Rotaria magnacalcarata]
MLKTKKNKILTLKKIIENEIDTKKENDDDQIDEPIVLPTYCDLILQGLQSRECFSAIKKPFFEQTSAHLLGQYSNSTSKSVHYSFVVALTEKFPILNYLNKDVDAHDLSNALSRKKRNIKYYKTHPTSKRPKLSTIEPNTNVEAGEQCVDESSKDKEREQEIVIVSSDRNISIGTSSNSNHLLNESRATGTFVPPSNITQQLSTPITARTTSNETSASPHSSRRATISLISPTSTQLSNVSTVNTTPVSNKLPLTTNSANTFLYVDGRMNLTAVQVRPVVAVHKALMPRVANKKSNNIPAPPNNTTSATTNKESNCIFRSISNDNIDERETLSNDESMCHL